MRIDALSELPGARQEAHLDEVNAITRSAAAAKKWTEYAESVEVRLRILDRLHREDEIRTQLHEVRAIVADGVAPTPEAACILNSILAISDLYFDDDEALSLASVAVRLAQAHRVDRWLLRAHTRRLLCYVLRGQLHTAAGRLAVQEALSAAEVGGDMKSKVGIYNNAGCYYVEVGDLDTGAQFLRHAATLACGPSERVLVLGNLGELHLQLGDLREAAQSFERGLELARSSPVFGFAALRLWSVTDGSSGLGDMLGSLGPLLLPAGPAGRLGVQSLDR
jgi:tetratricopeptide (TPR) repeat protein